MIISVLQSDIEQAQAARAAGNSEANPLLLALDRATSHDEDFRDARWVASKMAVFNEASYLADEPMPQLYLVSNANAESVVGGTDFFVLPAPAQIFMEQWVNAQPVAPQQFEIPLEVDPAEADPHSTERIHGLSDDMFENMRHYAQRLVAEANREIDLDPVLDPLKKGASRLNQIGQKPVLDIGKDLARLLVTPINLSSSPEKPK